MGASSRDPLDPAWTEFREVLADTTILSSSEGLPWPGLRVAQGMNRSPWKMANLALADHLVAINAGDARMQVSIGSRGEEIVVEPGGLRFSPAGDWYPHEVRAPYSFALVTITPQKLDSLLGGEPARIQRHFGTVRPQIEHLVRTFVAEAQGGGPSGPAFVDALSAALVAQIVEAFGIRAPPEIRAAAGLSPARLRRVLQAMEANIESGVPVETLAREAGLSAAHFARAFKRVMGRSPHQHLIAMRLERARTALLGGRLDLGEVAFRFGFADQAHFTRLYRRRYGETPGQTLKQKRRA
jgi:AraC family transcriptional regulator